MKKEIRHLGFWMLMFLAFGCTNPKKKALEKPERPNVIWIIAEDLSPDLECYGYDGVLTPNLNQLAANGVMFKNAFTTAPVCAPSRTALAVGMYQTAINAHHMRYPDDLKNKLPEGVVPINELFRRNGYQTALMKEAPANNKTDWSFATEFSTYDANMWKDFSKDKPFFAYFNLKLTHRPFERDTLNPVDPSRVKLPPYYPDHQVAREDWAQYLESVQIMDGQVGQVVDALKANGFWDNTIVVFFGDHGRPMTRGKNNLYDSGMQIPLIMSAPKNSQWLVDLKPGSTNSQLLSTIDITASSLAFAGIQKPEWMQGKVLFGENKEAERTEVVCALDRIGESHFRSRAIRTQRWKYIKNYHREKSINEMATAYRKAMHPIYHLLNIYNEKGLLTTAQQALVNPMSEEELYDLENDPYEIHNLVDEQEYTGQLEELRDKLENWHSETRDFGMEEDSEALKQAFDEYAVQSFENHKAKIEALRNEVTQKVME